MFSTCMELLNEKYIKMDKIEAQQDVCGEDGNLEWLQGEVIQDKFNLYLSNGFRSDYDKKLVSVSKVGWSFPLR